MLTDAKRRQSLGRRDFLQLTGSMAVGGLLHACAGKNQSAMKDTGPSEVLSPTVPEATPTVPAATAAELPTVAQEAPATQNRFFGGHVITERCIRDGACVEVCPVECIIPGLPIEEWPLYYIDPDTCIDCGACVPECPVEAIFPAEDLPLEFMDAVMENARFFSEGPGYDALGW